MFNPITACDGGYEIGNLDTASRVLTCNDDGTWTGQQGDEAIECNDINECKSNPCAHSGHCMDSQLDASVPVSAYRCDCAGGWTGDNCAEDIDECETDNGGCDPTMQTDPTTGIAAPLSACLNNDGSHDCGLCPNGYTTEWDECVDIFIAVNAQGTGAQVSRCEDIDECGHTGIQPCWLANVNGDTFQSQCTNIVGSFKCSECPFGFEGDGLKGGIGCEDIDECVPISENGGCDSHTTCQNQLGAEPIWYSGIRAVFRIAPI
jgi:hypothetical protein